MTWHTSHITVNFTALATYQYEYVACCFRPRDFTTKRGTISPGPDTMPNELLQSRMRRQPLYVSELHMSQDKDTCTVVLAAPGASLGDLHYSFEEHTSKAAPSTTVLRVSNTNEITERTMLSYAVDIDGGVPVYAAPSVQAPIVRVKQLGERIRGFAPVHFWVALAMGEGWIRVGEPSATCPAATATLPLAPPLPSSPPPPAQRGKLSTRRTSPTAACSKRVACELP